MLLHSHVHRKKDSKEKATSIHLDNKVRWPTGTHTQTDRQTEQTDRQADRIMFFPFFPIFVFCTKSSVFFHWCGSQGQFGELKLDSEKNLTNHTCHVTSCDRVGDWEFGCKSVSTRTRKTSEFN